MARKQVTDMSAWPALSLEGNLITPAMVAKIDRREAAEQTDYRFPPAIISHAVWLYHRFCVSFRDVEDPILSVTSSI